MKRILITTLLVACATTAQAAPQSPAGFVLSTDYMWFNTSISSYDLNLGAASVAAGYRFDPGRNFSVTPEIKVGTGVQDDSVKGGAGIINLEGNNYAYSAASITIELESLFMASARVEYSLNDRLYLHLTPSWVRARVSASGGAANINGQTVSSDVSWDETHSEFGVGGGLGFCITEHLQAESTWQKFGNIDSIALGLRYTF